LTSAAGTVVIGGGITIIDTTVGAAGITTAGTSTGIIAGMATVITGRPALSFTIE
jgi:hypothetical protein